MKPKILGTGLSGMVGSRIVELLSGKYDFEDLSLEKGVDITDRKVVEEKFSQFDGERVLHLAAKADVDGCEENKDEDIKILRYKDIKRFSGLKTAWAVNVEGTRNIVEAAKVNGKIIIYISTDFVFDGVNPPDDGYAEDDRSNPINWYGQTKYEGEKIVMGSVNDWLICRLAFPYRAEFEAKKDFLRAILAQLQRGEKVQVINDQIITPTFIDDIVFALDELMERQIFGVYHLVGGQSLTPYEAAGFIAKTFNQDENLIEGVRADDYFLGRAKRPFKLSLKNDKIRKLGVRMRTFEEGLGEVKKQMHNFQFTI